LQRIAFACGQGNQHKNREFTSKSCHPAAFYIAAKLVKAFGNFIDDPDPIGTGQGENDVDAHGFVLFEFCLGAGILRYNSGRLRFLDFFCKHFRFADHC
jgi:hypothetical protein